MDNYLAWFPWSPRSRASASKKWVLPGEDQPKSDPEVSEHSNNDDHPNRQVQQQAHSSSTSSKSLPVVSCLKTTKKKQQQSSSSSRPPLRSLDTNTNNASHATRSRRSVTFQDATTCYTIPPCYATSNNKELFYYSPRELDDMLEAHLEWKRDLAKLQKETEARKQRMQKATRKAQRKERLRAKRASRINAFVNNTTTTTNSVNEVSRDTNNPKTRRAETKNTAGNSVTRPRRGFSKASHGTKKEGSKKTLMESSRSKTPSTTSTIKSTPPNDRDEQTLLRELSDCLEHALNDEVEPDQEICKPTCRDDNQVGEKPVSSTPMPTATKDASANVPSKTTPPPAVASPNLQQQSAWKNPMVTPLWNSSSRQPKNSTPNKTRPPVLLSPIQMSILPHPFFFCHPDYTAEEQESNNQTAEAAENQNSGKAILWSLPSTPSRTTFSKEEDHSQVKHHGWDVFRHGVHTKADMKPANLWTSFFNPYAPWR
ncbi:expressed unknown protein [Seminavis robusta]|uniref:Uncharacterized protein n=1 Tax=Seminavis robusta TaxID=568900 RepID=A0A9N8EUN1_9STRA|nr:expressed unknown protein [Seminavis robusta]|eukprot:Sro1811_g299180.1 n/a (484) ;mRNA; f:6509-7960